MVSFGFGFDSEENRTTDLNGQFPIKNKAIVNVGTSTTRTEFDEGEENNYRTFYAGVKSDPLADWQYGLMFEFADPSPQLGVSSVLVPLIYQGEDFSVQFTPGYRLIRVKLTQVFQNTEEYWDDFSPTWGLQADYFITDQLYAMVSYQKFYYHRNFRGLTSDLAIILAGYFPATVSEVSGFLDHRFGGTLGYDWKRFGMSLDFNHYVYEFANGLSNDLSLAVDFNISKRWSASISRGWSRSEANSELTEGRFSNISFSYSW